VYNNRVCRDLWVIFPYTAEKSEKHVDNNHVTPNAFVSFSANKVFVYGVERVVGVYEVYELRRRRKRLNGFMKSKL